MQNDYLTEIKCPHCRRLIEGGHLLGAKNGRRGIKCPHCRLLVPLDRVQVANGNAPA